MHQLPAVVNLPTIISATVAWQVAAVALFCRSLNPNWGGESVFLGKQGWFGDVLHVLSAWFYVLC